MPRVRKPQNGGQRLWTGRVANTTTGSTTTQTVYRIPTRGAYGECEKLAYEVLGTSPIRVAIEWEDIYRVSLDEAALKDIIENYENLDLSNVTLQTVNGDVEFVGNITSDWTFTWSTVNAENLSATSGDITTLTSTTATIDTLNATTSSLWTATATSVDTWTLAVSGTSQFTWDVTAEGNVTIAWALTAAEGDIAALTSASATIEALAVTNGATIANGLTADATTTETLDVNWASNFTGDITAVNINATWNTSLDTLIVSWNSTLNTLTANWATTLNGNASVAGNISVTWNETITGNVTVTWDWVFSNDVSISRNLNVSGDTTITDDLTVNGTTHLKWLETDGSVDIDWTLRVSGAINGLNWLNITGQVESETVRTNEVIANEVRVTDGLYLSAWAEAPDFILQSEKGEPNGVCPLNNNGIVDTQYLPPIYTSAIVKIWTGVFSNSNTSTVIDNDITADSYVHISNYQDIVWDLDENIVPWQITVVSNTIENWSYKYIVVNPLNACNS